MLALQKFIILISSLLKDGFPDRKKDHILYYFFIEKGQFKIVKWYWGNIRKKYDFMKYGYSFSCHNGTIFYERPKIFINCTIFAEFVSHFSGRIDEAF